MENKEKSSLKEMKRRMTLSIKRLTSISSTSLSNLIGKK
jgi:hypothetical protein